MTVLQSPWRPRVPFLTRVRIISSRWRAMLLDMIIVFLLRTSYLIRVGSLKSLVRPHYNLQSHIDRHHGSHDITGINHHA